MRLATMAVLQLPHATSRILSPGRSAAVSHGASLANAVVAGTTAKSPSARGPEGSARGQAYAETATVQATIRRPVTRPAAT